MNEFATEADEHINSLIETLCDEADRDVRFDRHDTAQRRIDQIAKLRASQNPTIVQNFQR